jgi:hypothetical protein
MEEIYAIQALAQYLKATPAGHNDGRGCAENAEAADERGIVLFVAS